MKRHLSVDDLARDARFERVAITDRLTDPRTLGDGSHASSARTGRRGGRCLEPSMTSAPDVARSMMHGIFVGEIQALEGAGRTCFDFDVGPGNEEIPFELKLDMARQCWDEARHVEISCKLADFMGTEIGEYGESTILFEAACNADPALRLAGVNRALEGLAIDVFNTMREFGQDSGDPVLEFCEDWMLADEVTHVKMGSDWLRRLTAADPRRRERALEFQRVVDKLFSYGGLRGDDEQSPVRLARRFRELAGFDAVELDEIGDLSREAAVDRKVAAAERRRRAEVA